MKVEMSDSYYDKVYAQGYNTERYQPIYRSILKLLENNKNKRILEIGCGTGTLGGMLVKEGFDYRGFDFSAEAVRQASQVCGDKTIRANAYEESSYQQDYDIVIAVEVLEHLDDLKILSMLKEGTIVILTVPNFDDPAHIRVYESEEQIRERFGRHLIVHQVRTFQADDGAKFFLVVGHKVKTIVANTLSVCMIVKDEEENLPRALDSIAAIADEIIVVDTGSNDKTVEIAEKFGCKVFHEEWQDNFSLHRNRSLAEATGGWLFILDADEEVVADDLPVLKAALELEKVAQGLVIQLLSIYEGDKKSTSFLPQLRIFRNGMGFHYERSWHNELMSPTGVRLKRLNCRINHYGYDLSPEKSAIKQARLEKMAQMTLAETPDDPFQLYNAAEVLRSDGRHFREDKAEEIIQLTRKAAMLTDPRQNPNWGTHIMSLNLCGWAYFYAGDIEKAVSYGHQAVSYKPNYLDAIFLLGLAYERGKSHGRAIQWLNEYLDKQSKYNPAEEIDPVSIRHLENRPDVYLALGRIFENTKETEKAKSCYLMALKTRPGNDHSLKFLNEQELTEAELALVEKFGNKREVYSGSNTTSITG